MNTEAAPAQPDANGSIVFPLDEFYARYGVRLPPVQQIEPGDIPEPYRGLLVHEHDMTSTLESFHQGGLHLRVIARERHSHEYFREVVLCLDGSERPVEFGATRIDLDAFAPAARRLILEEHQPLGGILKTCGLPFASRPLGYLRIASDRLINSLLGLQGAHILYGRRNRLLHAEGRPMAEVVEILPPLPDPRKTHG